MPVSTIRAAIIMAGGAGERFWPLSTPTRPKHLLNLTRPDKSLLDEATSRIQPLVGDSVYIATSGALKQVIEEANLVPQGNVLGEPLRRNTLGCLVWVTAQLMAKHPETWRSITAAILTADHWIGDENAFRQTVELAMQTAEEKEAIVTIGIQPTRPETGYGYIHAGGSGIAPSLGFKEKPDADTAAKYLSSGDYYWNSGMFFWTLTTFVRELESAHAEAAETLQKLAVSLTKQEEGSFEPEHIFGTLPNISIDYALLEKAQNVYVVPSNFQWDDVGSWDAIERSFPQDTDQNTVRGHAIVTRSKGTIVVNESSNVTVGVVGLEDVIVVVTDDAVLVCSKSHAQNVREVAMLANKGHK